MPIYQPITDPYKFPKKQLGEIEVASVTGFLVGEVVYQGANIGAATASAVIKRINTARKVLIVNEIDGIFQASTAVKQDSGSVSSNAHATQNRAFNLSITDKGVVKTQVIGSRVLTEVLRAYNNQATKISDLGAQPTFTAALSTGPWVTDDVITITVTASERVRVEAGSYITVQAGNGTVRHAVYDSEVLDGSDWTYLFNYTVVAGDCSVVTGANAGLTIGEEIVGDVFDPIGTGGVEEAVADTSFADISDAAAEVNVEVITVTITSDPDPASVTAPASVDFTADASIDPVGGTLHYQWKLNNVNVGTDSADYTLADSTGHDGHDVVCVVTSTRAVTATSDPITLTVA
jgi:hypothetical protein